jgi:hypothetical protein
VTSNNVKEGDVECVIDDLNLEDLCKIRRKLGIVTREEGTTTIQSLKDDLDKITVNKLKEYLSGFGFDVDATKSIRKGQLQRMLFESILQREITLNTPTKPTSNDNDQDYNWLWNKGAWLSLNANYNAQIEYLGSILLIW